MPRPAALVTLTTDFGLGSPYVAAMKGVILSIAPHVQIVDLTHGIPPQDIRAGAWTLDEFAPWFPPGAVHVGVVDPGVGSARRIVYAQIGPHHYIAPDNGLLSRLADRIPPTTMRVLAEPRYWLPQVSHTFHGRDIMSPVAARLTLDLDPALLGPETADWVRLTWPEVQVLPGQVTGTVRLIDSFGNLITDISAAHLADAPRDQSVRIICDEHETLGLFQTYADQPPMTLVALLGSSGYLELAIVDDSASAMLGVRVGAPVSVCW